VPQIDQWKQETVGESRDIFCEMAGLASCNKMSQ
jgi:hypothetical protein